MNKLWILLGLLTIIVTIINLILFFAKADYRYAMVTALSLTALTMCAFYSSLLPWVEANDWAAIMDVVPGMSRAQWVLAFLSIGFNVLPLLFDKRVKSET